MTNYQRASSSLRVGEAYHAPGSARGVPPAADVAGNRAPSNGRLSQGTYKKPGGGIDYEALRTQLVGPADHYPSCEFYFGCHTVNRS